MTQDTDPESRNGIAIVGGGYAAAALLVALLRRTALPPLGLPPLSLHVFEPAEQLGCGLAYGMAAPWHSLNITAARASLFADDPGHFWQWAKLQGQVDAAPGAYLPRALFGRYVNATLQQAIQASPHRLVHHRQPVRSIRRRHDGGFQLVLPEGAPLDCAKLVLAAGALPPRLPPVPGLEAARQAGLVVANPWALEELRRLPADRPVFILGTALTMADAVLSLRRLGHRGRITALSRHGVIPAARADLLVTEPPLSLADSQQGCSRILQRLRQAARLAVQQHGTDHWQGMVESLRPITRSFWHALPAAEKARFARHLRSFWDAHRYRMPPDTAAILAAEMAQGSLVVEKGRLLAMQVAADSLAVTIRRRGAAQDNHIDVAAMVLCAGPKPSGDEAILLDALESDGLARRDPLGMGLDALPDGQLVDCHGHAVAGLHGLGPILRGVHLECTAIADIRDQASNLADALV